VIPSKTRSVWISFRSNPLLILSAGYLSVLLLTYIRYGIVFQFSLGIISLAVLPVTLVLGQTARFLRELSPFLLILLAYEALEGLAGTVWVAPVVQIVGPRGLSSQSWVTMIQTTFYSPFLTQLTTVFYSLHFLLIVVSAVVLWYSNKFLYNSYMSSLVICSYVSLIFYVLFPTAPPWYNGVATNLLQTSTTSSSQGLVPSLIQFGEMIESDKLAAFPSLHAAYAVLFCYFTMKVKRIYGLASVPIMIGVLFSTIYLGQHYLVDIVAGAGVAIASTFIARRLVVASVTGRINDS
jgi:membrane-associated phospholipid phosphatase